MLVLQMLPQQCNRALRVVWINFWQVDVIDEVDQFSLARGAIVCSSFLHKWDAHGVLQHRRGSVEIEVDDTEQNLARIKLRKHAVHNLCLTSTWH